MAVTLKELAARLEMHPSTVSRALREHSTISAATREHVRALAAELGYEPNPVARGLVAGHTGMIGFIVTEVPGSFVPSMIEAANRVAAEAGLGTVLSVVANDQAALDAELDRLRRKRVDGLLIHRWVPRLTPGVKRLIDDGVPYVFAGCKPWEGNPGPYVAWDDSGGTRVATEHFASLGYEQIAYFGIEHPRARGYREAMASLGLEPRCVICRGGLWQQGWRAAERVLEIDPLPRAVVCFSDSIAYGLLARLAEEGLDVPGDVAVIGQDDLWVSSLPQVRLSSIHYPRKEIGRGAAEVLLSIIDRRPAASQVIPGRLVIRRTCGGSPEEDDLGWWRKAGGEHF